MQISYGKFYSRHLSRDMEYKVYGTRGKPVLVIPCQGGRFYEFEDMRMLDVYAPYIEDGRIQVFTIDSLDNQTLFGKGSPRERICLHEAWINYIMEEAVPHFSHLNTLANGWEIRFLAAGLSLGALHAATLFFRYPDVFDALLALSGIYTNEYCFGDYHDDLTYMNSPQQFVAGIAPAAVAEEVAGPPHQGFGIGIRSPHNGQRERERHYQRQDPGFSHTQHQWVRNGTSGAPAALRTSLPTGILRSATPGRTPERPTIGQR